MTDSRPRCPDEKNEHASAAPHTDAVDALHDPTSRRAFLRRASALTLAVPGLGAALTACSPEQQQTTPPHRGAQSPSTSAGAREPQRVRNPDSKLDTALHHGAPHSATTSTSALNPLSTPLVRYDPTLPPLAAGHSLDLHFTPVKRRSASRATPWWRVGPSRETFPDPSSTAG